MKYRARTTCFSGLEKVSQVSHDQEEDREVGLPSLTHRTKSQFPNNEKKQHKPSAGTTRESAGPWEHTQLSCRIRGTAKLLGISVLSAEGLCHHFHARIPSLVHSEPSKEQNHEADFPAAADGVCLLHTSHQGACWSCWHGPGGMTWGANILGRP